jgi:hypothetical protein
MRPLKQTWDSIVSLLSRRRGQEVRVCESWYIRKYLCWMVLYNLSTIFASIKFSFGANIFLEEASLGEYKATQVMWRAILLAGAELLGDILAALQYRWERLCLHLFNRVGWYLSSLDNL